MKDILRILRFDFLTVSELAIPIYLFGFVFIHLLSILTAPMLFLMLVLVSLVFIIPLQPTAEKCEFHKLYGVLPIRRKSITRARFLYLLLVFLVGEGIVCLSIWFSLSIKFYRFLPNQDSVMMQMVGRTYESSANYYVAAVIMTFVIGLIFLYMEMTGQIFGREHHMRIIMITLGVVTVLILGLLELSDRGIIPYIRIPDFPQTTEARLRLAAIANAILIGAAAVFGEITAHVLSKREL